ncbi:MAG: hypothetical protein EZS28_046712, partial [Streblomastix strix]
MATIEKDNAEKQPEEVKVSEEDAKKTDDGTAAVSKNLQKKQKKQQEAAQKKADKEAQKKVIEQAKKKDEVEIEDPRLYHEKRLNMVSSIAPGAVNPYYPHKFHANISVGEFIAKYSNIEVKEEKKDEVVSLGARVMFFRSLGKMIFFDVQSNGLKLQLVAKKDIMDVATSP